MWVSDICKYKCSNAKVPPWRFLMKISPFTAVEFRLCNIPKIIFCCYHVQISLSMLQQTQSDIFHTKMVQNALWCQITWSKCMLCNILEYICKYKCSNAKVPPWRSLMKISPFTAVEFRLCNIPKLTYSLIYCSY
jgi:hypothetical protein